MLKNRCHNLHRWSESRLGHNVGSDDVTVRKSKSRRALAGQGDIPARGLMAEMMRAHSRQIKVVSRVGSFPFVGHPGLPVHHGTARRASYDRIVACFLVTCFAAASLVSAQTDSEDDDAYWVREQFKRAYNEQDWPKAIEAGLELNERTPGNRWNEYSLASVYSMNGDAESAVKWLGKAAENGFSQVTLIQTDPDLIRIREHPGYQTALAVVKENHQRELTRLRKRFERQEPLTFPPPNHDPSKPAPLIIALHGYGAIAQRLAEQWRNAAGEVGAILIVPQAVRRVKGTHGFNWGHIDEADFLVDLTLEFARKKYKIDDHRVVLTGFSQGAYIAYAVALRHPETFVGVIPMAGGYIQKLDRPSKVSTESAPRFYFMVGERDHAVQAATEAVNDFAEAGYGVELRIYPKVGHTFPLERDEELRKALKFVLRRKP